MKYRIRKEIYINNKGEENARFYPQHKHWWSWWHYFGSDDGWSSYDVFSTLEEAIEFIRIEIEKKVKGRTEYIYLDDRCNIIYE